jgi:hypothetical protein
MIKTARLSILCASALLVVSAEAQTGADQTKPGAGNAAAAAIALNSAMVQTSYTFLQRQINLIQDNYVRFMTSDALQSSTTCIFSRANLAAAQKTAIVQTLTTQGLVNPPDANSINGGVMAGIFPPVVNDGTACPQLPMPIYAAPGSAFGGHHSYPGGLMVHETFNSVSDMNFADGYRRVYGTSASGVPTAASQDVPLTEPNADVFIDQDLIVAAPMWHDWAKPIVFQWNADGTEFTELNFGGNGSTDAYGKAGDSRTGAHHIITIAEMMARSMPPELIVTMACAHNTPTGGAEYKVVNWIRAGAILAQVDPVARGYLYTDTAGQLRLPQFRALGSIDLLQGSSLAHTNTLAEYVIHNLSDSDFTLTGESVLEAQSVLAAVAPQFGFSSTDTTNYNNKFRNPVLSNIPAERLLMLYGNGGTGTVVNAINAIKSKLGS